ncbi:MAG TPA: NEW3 domain-containing protein [Stellaceae bacterium]|nr:NEW3 domain-containing protein [Stellaceae bacterium]
MMRPFAFVVGLLLALAAPSFAADTTTQGHLKGLWLTTDYPSVTARAGDSTTIKVKLQNYGLPPERVALSVDGVPSGWTATVLGGGAPVTAAMPATDDSVPLQLRLDIPAGAAKATQTVTLRAKAADANISLPVDVSIGQLLPAKLVLKTKNPSLIGTAKTSFEFQFNVANQSDRDLVVNFKAQAPQGFRTTFEEAYGTQEIASIPIEAGKNKDLKVKVQPPSDAKAGDYPVAVEVAAENATADGSMTMDITGQPQLKLTGQDGRLSTGAVAGTATPVALTLSNDGSAPARDIALSSSPPSDWKVTFQPDKVAELAPGQKIDVQAQLTPSSKAVAGDYMTTFRANGSGSDSSSADIRVTVSTSTLWGIVGVAIVAIALLIAVGAVARFGRR